MASYTCAPGKVGDFARLYCESYWRIVKVHNAMLRDQAAAEDCVQGDFVFAYRSGK